MSTPYVPAQFAEKFQLAVDESLKNSPQTGLCGLEVEWKLRHLVEQAGLANSAPAV